MRIGIDARLINETGVGRYIKNLLHHLAEIDVVNEYVIFLPESAFETFLLPNVRWQKRLVRIRWHTIREQIVLPIIYLKENLDLLHVPYFTVPLLYPGKIITTIHDITILHFRTGKSTTLPYPLYLLKWLVYKIILIFGIKKSVSILTVSNTVKKELEDNLHVSSDKITVTYEGVDPIFGVQGKDDVPLPYSYFLYVGNVYPHKQAEFLVRSYKKFIDGLSMEEKNNPPRLVFVGKNDFFYERLKSLLTSVNLSEWVIFMNSVSDRTLQTLYKNTLALVFPSASEGFGLPALEALSQNALVLASDIPVFHELLADTAIFLPHDEVMWSQGLRSAWNKQYPPIQTETIQKFLQKYSWKELANSTKQLYEHSTRI